MALELEEELEIKYEKSEHIIKALIDQTALLSDSEKSGSVSRFFGKIMKSDFLLNLTNEQEKKLVDYISAIKINSEGDRYVLELPNGTIDLKIAVDGSHESVFLGVTSEISNNEISEEHTEDDLNRQKIIFGTYGKKGNSNEYGFEKDILSNFEKFLTDEKIKFEQKKVAKQVEDVIDPDNFDEVLKHIEKTY